MMSSAWLVSAARARASCGFWCASLSRSLHDGAAPGAVVAAQHVDGPLVQLLDRRQPRHPERFAPDDNRQRQRSGDGEDQRDIAERLTAGKEILDQVDDAEP